MPSPTGEELREFRLITAPSLAAIPFNELFQKIEPPAMMVFA
jgi:hypothetical protein